jgi:cytochrome c peroxidase
VKERAGIAILLVSTCVTALGQMPRGFPQPSVPADNPMTPAKVELGRDLFYDTRMSINGKASCATCHKQEMAFTDGRTVSVGATGELHPRGAMSLVNVAYGRSFTWNNPEIKTLEDQARVPMFNDHPVELGVQESAFLGTLRSDPKYVVLFEEAFPDEADRFSIKNVTQAIASFERSIISAQSPYDRYHYGGDDNAVSASAKHGEVLFYSQPLACFTCHAGFNFTDGQFHDNGVGNMKAPTLRNIAITAPYMHDGRFATLDAVLDHYASRAGITLSSQDHADLIAFLQTLTDQAVLHDARFSDPWSRR